MNFNSNTDKLTLTKHEQRTLVRAEKTLAQAGRIAGNGVATAAAKAVCDALYSLKIVDVSLDDEIDHGCDPSGAKTPTF